MIGSEHMNRTVIIVMFLTFIITIIGTLAYSVRIVGVKTGKIAVSFSLFNILVLVSRCACTIQAPILTKYVEINKGVNIVYSFYMILISAGIATIIGAFCIPTFQRVFSKWVMKFSIERSVPKIIIHSFSRAGIKQLKSCMKLPEKDNIKKFDIRNIPTKIIVYNIVVVGIQSVGILAPIYAGIIEPSLRATCITLSGVINGLATILLYIYIYPYLSVKTDDVIDGKCTESEFTQCVVGMVGSKIIGTFLAVPLLIPASKLIVVVANIIP
jgi:hypothetical protein